MQADHTDKAQPAAPNLARRSLLKAAPLGALFVAGAQAQAQGLPALPLPAAAPLMDGGYHETAHIRRYYHSAAYW